jgi:hypothetical protein
MADRIARVPRCAPRPKRMALDQRLAASCSHNDRKEVLGYVETLPRPGPQPERDCDDRQPSGQKVAGVREAIKARGATLRYLPKYSPDLKPIEMSLSLDLPARC